MSITLNVPKDRPPFKCTKCGSPALGIYAWDTKPFSITTTHKKVFCATCGLGIADVIRSFEDANGEMIYYKPNSNVRIIVRFNYEHPTRPAADRVAEVPTQHRRRPNPRVVRHLLDDGGMEITSHIPRVWCETCEAAVRPLVSEVTRTREDGKTTTKRFSICTVCGSKTHNPDMK